MKCSICKQLIPINEPWCEFKLTNIFDTELKTGNICGICWNKKLTCQKFKN